MAHHTQEDGGIHFPFPFPPYSIQKEFMAELYQVLETGKIGIFESPTGTVSGPMRQCGPELETASVVFPVCLCGDCHGVVLGKAVSQLIFLSNGYFLY
jgi:Rad3-related DNA helicase